ncbi:pathogenesis-related thaumatin superfamily protein [Actinidia rufa]|uniref:Pathogenesis-related thaumatin superfamily protein n=1 Tax=Actinidia rufa TaxID=165716 RepID=A0A7J0EU22_9ERIC|nr:pathogenesis-related thaumatin superfamily protein [Actinidia rufa]
MDLLSWPSSPLILTFSLTIFALSRGKFQKPVIFSIWVFTGLHSHLSTNATTLYGQEFSQMRAALVSAAPDSSSPKDTSRAFQAPTGWSGRFWARTGCKFDGSGSGYCNTGDCGSGHAECDGAGASPPATLAEFTLGPGGLDFYDVSLVDGYNLPVLVEAGGGSGTCGSTGCVTDLNRQCPAELRVEAGSACKSACEAFGTPEYCCSGAYNSPAACKPTVYSEMFKSACPRSYSYAYDDPTSTFTCSGADYTVTFCPTMPSQKSTTDSPSTTDGSVSETIESDSGTEPTVSGSETVYSDTGSGSEAMLADGSWLAGLAMGNSAQTLSPPLSSVLIASATLSFILSFLYF